MGGALRLEPHSTHCFPRHYCSVSKIRRRRRMACEALLLLLLCYSSCVFCVVSLLRPQLIFASVSGAGAGNAGGARRGDPRAQRAPRSYREIMARSKNIAPRSSREIMAGVKKRAQESLSLAGSQGARRSRKRPSRRLAPEHVPVLPTIPYPPVRGGSPGKGRAGAAAAARDLGALLMGRGRPPELDPPGERRSSAPTRQAGRARAGARARGPRIMAQRPPGGRRERGPPPAPSARRRKLLPPETRCSWFGVATIAPV